MKTKTHLIAALMILSSMKSYSQPGYNNPIGDIEYKRGATYLESTLPPAPEAASAVKYVDVPFLHCMGVAQLDIPFYTLKGNELSIPVGLSYASGGIKLDDIAGVAGLGWTLNAGGCITRTVMDQPDEFSLNGFRHQMPSGTLLEKLLDMENTDNDKESYAFRIASHHIDAKLDRYSYNVCGLSGSFVIMDDGQVFQLSGDGVKITYTGSATSGGISSFTITGPDGTRYYCSVKEVGTHDGTNGQLPNIMEGVPDRWTATTAWFVSSVTSRSGKETAEFSYYDGPNWSRDINTRTTSVTISSSITLDSHLSYSTATSRIVQTYTTKILESITLRGETVSFTYTGGTGKNYHEYGEGNTVEYNYPVKLAEITASTLGGREIKSLYLDTKKETEDGRIILNSLTFRGLNNDIYDTWSFSYNTRDYRVSHYAQDWYGFYNGVSSGFGDCAPYHYRRQSSSTCGNPDANEASYMSLVEYNHNGAISQISYEGNTIGNYSIGVRVMSIVSADRDPSTTEARIRSFRYYNPKADGPTYPTEQMYTTVSPPFTISDMNDMSMTGSTTWTFTYHETPVVKGPSIRDTRVYYGKVSEFIGKNRLVLGNNKIAETVYYYDTQQTNRSVENVYSRFPSAAEDNFESHPPYGNMGYNPFQGIQTTYVDWGPVCAPVLTRQEEYAWSETDTIKLVSATNYTYDNPSRESVLVEYAAEQVWHPFGYGSCTLADMFHFPVYASNCRQRQKIVESHIQYHADGGKDSVVINTAYLSRGNNLELPSRVSEVSMEEGGKTRKWEYVYADNSDALYAPVLAQQHYVSAPLCTKYYTDFADSSPFNFHEDIGHPSVGGGVFPPFGPSVPIDPSLPQLELYDTSPTMEIHRNFGYFNIPGSALLPSASIEYTHRRESWREEVLSRDCRGNVQQLKEKGKPNTVILWSYDGRYPVAVIENATLIEVASVLVIPHVDADAPWPVDPIEDLTKITVPRPAQIQAVNNLRTSLPNAHVTTFTFDPGIGMTSITDASGIKISYEYDFAGRLLAVKDSDGNLVEDYEYNLLEDDNDHLLSILRKVYRTSDGNQYCADKTWWNTLGLRQQDIAFGASGDGKDLVTAYESDFMLHDDVRTWLPYPVNNSGGDFQNRAKNSAATFHNNTMAYYSKDYEVSNRNKVQSSSLPGFDGEYSRTECDSSSTAFPKLAFYLSGMVADGTYSSWEISKTTVTDEDGRSKSEYRDHAGRLLGTSVGDDEPSYYVYDCNDRLVAVVGSGIGISDTLNMWRYSYDSLGRVCSKGIPGSVRENYHYDEEDRITVIDRADGTKEIEYDDFGRIRQIFLTDTANADVLVEDHYYDGYPGSGIVSQILSYADNWNGPVKDLETFSRIALIDEDGEMDGYAQTIYLYDWKARIVRRITEYPDGGILDENITYNFPGEKVSTVLSYTKDGNTDMLAMTASYDVRGRMASSASTLAAHGCSPVGIGTSYSYDALGRPAVSTIISDDNEISIEDSYTLQGWLAGHDVIQDGINLFNETLSYDTDSGSSHTGLIMEKQEGSGNGLFIPLYITEYKYDYAGRLVQEKDGSNQFSGKTYEYDARGNILSSRNMTSFFLSQNSRECIYAGDRLTTMNDKRGSTVTGTYSFTYDNLGRMTHDGLSGLQMEYNHLDLPRKVISGGTTLVNYSYLADGTKTSSLKPTGEGLVYRGPFVYRRDADGTMTLESAACSEGRLTPDRALLYVTDHLGSVRYVIDGNTGAQLEISDYTAYGTRSGSSLQPGAGLTLRDHFTGQEDQMPDFSVPYSDHGARHYNPALLRWMVPDPLSEKYYGQSPYNYCGSNPVNFVDLDGREVVVSGSEAFKQNYNEMREWLRENNCDELLTQLENNQDIIITIMESTDKNGYETTRTTIGGEHATKGNILLDFTHFAQTDKGNLLSPSTKFMHEVDHAAEAVKDYVNFNKLKEQSFGNYGNPLELQAINTETHTAISLGEIPVGTQSRTSHFGKDVGIPNTFSVKQMSIYCGRHNSPNRIPIINHQKLLSPLPLQY